jgi:hypothetical protein
MAIFNRDTNTNQQQSAPAENKPLPPQAATPVAPAMTPRAAGAGAPTEKIRRTRKIKSKADALAEKIAEMQGQLRAAQEAERKAHEAELLRLVRRADCLAEAIEWARAKLA